ncbi:hypothetical protein F4780DRAFT_724900 [Xylariomycetidae sp. FL0641]|nr:hypothetical protein F4780DRAFT_724900 [Xylariomycetidae sp. FL0641]
MRNADLPAHQGVQGNKRHRSEVFVYHRQDEEAVSIPREPPRPTIHTSQPNAPTPAFQSTLQQSSTANGAAHGNVSADAASQDAAADADAATEADHEQTSEPRRFHMSRKDMILGASYPSRTHGGVSKKRSAPALFVERRIKRISSRTVEKLHSAANTPTPAQSDASGPEGMEIDRPEPRKFKKPGVAKLKVEEGAHKYKAELPKTLTARWNVDMERLAADMDKYTMEQIGLNLQKAEDEKQATKAKTSTSSKLKYRPKPPAKRYAERHPEVAQTAADKDMVDADHEASDSDDGEYIIETYVRVPASRMGDKIPSQQVGLLVFDDEPDMNYFYGEGEDSEDEWAEDEEDENAENYYTADYPDEEVASDDEYGQNPYAYRNNASDDEYDLDEDSEDDPFGDDKTHGQFRSYIGRNGQRSNHL